MSRLSRERRLERRQHMRSERQTSTRITIDPRFPAWALGSTGLFRCDRCSGDRDRYAATVDECQSHDASVNPQHVDP
jgi:hypothetical protein